jgi:hypothetical protein
MQIPHPDQRIEIFPRRAKKFSIFHKWGIEICNAKHNHGVWIADLFKVNYISIGFKSRFGFRYTKFFYGSNHRHLRIGFIYVNWGFYTKIHKEFKYKKINGEANNNRRSKK